MVDDRHRTPLLTQEQMDGLVEAMAENHAKMMEQDWTPEQKRILTENLVAVRAAAESCRALLNAVREK